VDLKLSLIELKIKDIKEKWEDITVDDFELLGYFYHPSN